MKVLNVNKYFYIKGGAETYYFELTNMLRKHNNEVMEFSMKHENNFESKYSKYFIDNIDYYTQTKPHQKIGNALKIIYSREAKRKLNSLLSKEKPDIAHLQNFHHQLSTSILDVFEKYDIPVVYTAHDLKLVCGNYKMLTDEGICEACKGHKYENCIKKRCVKNSLANSVVTYLEMTRAYKKKMIDKIDYIVTPSRFYRDKMIEFGVDPDKIEFIPNFIDQSNYVPCYESDDYFVYFGRLAEEKGVFTLLDAMKMVNGPKLYIIGGGPLEDEIKKRVELDSDLSKKVELLGYKKGEELKDLLKRAKFNILPSEWYENGPYSVLEMMCLGKPTIGANIGGIPDLVRNGECGYLFESGNYKDLAAKINMLCANPDDIVNMGKNCRKVIEQEHTADVYYERIMKVYNKVLENKKKK